MLVDTRMRLIAIGDDQFDGHSPRSAMDLVGRVGLLPSLKQCALDGRSRDIRATVKDRPWSVHVRGITAPTSGVPLAVHGCYVAEGDPVPPPPTVGSWEWEISPPGPNQVMRTYWSPDLYRLHGMRPRPREEYGSDWDVSGWEGPQWLDELLVPADRAEMRRIIDRAITAPTDALLTHTYRVRSPDTGETRHLRFAGQRWIQQGANEPPWWWRGITLRLPSGVGPAERPATAPLLDATFTLSRDPLFAVDVDYEHLYLTSRSFADLGLAVPANRHLPSMCHPDDLTALRTMLHACARSAGSTDTRHTIQIRLANRDNGWTALTISGVGVLLGDTTPHVLCRAEPTRPPCTEAPWPR